MRQEIAGRLGDEIHRSLGYRFESQALLMQAFCHTSYLHENPEEVIDDNERLEFLGDSVLDLAVGQMLMELFPAAREGELSKLRASLVSEAGLAGIAGKLGLGRLVLLGKGEEAGGGREKPSILADTFEALVGALYLEAGLQRTMEVLRGIFTPLMDEMGSNLLAADYKSLLQELTQQRMKTLPRYILLEESGPPHARTFRVGLSINGMHLSEGRGRSKKEAEQVAAKEAYLALSRK
jgi:ribonuclease III